MNKQITAISIVALVSACASSPDKMTAMDVSPLKYQSYTCTQIGAESDRISRKVGQLYQHLKGEADADAWQMGVGLVLLWPMLFALEGGDGAEAVEYRQLKGEYDALQQMAIRKECGLNMPALKDTLPKEKPATAKKSDWAGDE